MDTPSSTIGPGLGAFVAFFVLALALWLLMRNMNARMRRIAYREQQRVAEIEARDAPTSEPAGSGPGPATGSPHDASVEPSTTAQEGTDDTL